MNSTDWFVAVSNTNCERRATQGLVDAGFEVWWPTRIVVRNVPRTKLKVERLHPAFPGYLFTRQTSALDWQNMIGVDGLKAVLCNDFRPFRIPDAEIERVKKQLAPLAQSVAVVSMPVGSPVVITEGPLAGVRGLLTAILGRGAVEVAVSMFGGSAAVSVARENVEVG